jgi:hypothetical protein
MKKLLRVTSSGLGGAAMVGLFGLVLLPWLGGPALFGADFGDIYRLLMAEQARGGALDTRVDGALHSIDAKHEIAAELTAGRMTLAEAADRFERLAGMMDDGQDDLLGPYRTAAGDRPAIYRQVIRWVEVSLQDQPREQAEVVARLERELARLEAGAARTTH